VPAEPQRASFHPLISPIMSSLLEPLTSTSSGWWAGSRFGGNVSLLVAAQAPDRVCGLVVRNAGARGGPARRSPVTFVAVALAAHSFRRRGSMSKVFRMLPAPAAGRSTASPGVFRFGAHTLRAAANHCTWPIPSRPTVDQ
jgi:pimeloyl-ACP methyl ester carboxylesterase